MSMVFSIYGNGKLEMTLSLAEMEENNDAGQDGIDLTAEITKLAPGERFAWGGGAEPLYEAVAVYQDIPTCDQCQMLNINGVNCHETGCPNSKKTWVADQGWVRFLECSICGCDVEEGEVCGCEENDQDDHEDHD